MSGKGRPHTDPAEHARLQKALRESVILRELADILNSSLDLEQILLELVKRTTELCEIPRCAVWLLDEAGTHLRPITYYLANATLSLKKRKAADTVWFRSSFLMDSPIIERLLGEGGVLLIDDLRVEPMVQTFAKTFQVCSVLLIALLRDGQPVGLMSLDNPGKAFVFSQEQQQLARAIGQQATIAIHNARLYQQAQIQQQRADHLIERAQAVYQVAMRVNSGEELPVVLQLATEHLARSLNASGGFVLLLETDKTELRPIGEMSQEARTHLEAIGLSLDDLPNLWLAVHTGKPLLVTAEQAQDREIEWFQRFGLRNILLVPLMGGSPREGANWDLPGATRILPHKEGEDLLEVYCPGLIVLHFTRRRKPTAGEYAFAQDIAAQCALAIEKARLLAEAHQAATLATERAETLDAAFQAMNEGITVVTSDEQVQVRNHAVARFLGVPVHSSWPLETFVQNHPAYTLDGQFIPFEDFAIVRALRGQFQVRGERFLATRADGLPRVVELTATSLRNSDMQQIGLVCAIRDVTVQVQAEQRVRQALDTFLHIAKAVSHSLEIREILHSVLAEALKTLNCTRGTVHLFQQSFEPLLSLGFTPDEEARWLQKQELWLNPQTGQEFGFFARLMDGEATLVSEEHCQRQPNPFAETLVLAAPIKHNQRILGLLLLDRSPTTAPTLPSRRPPGFTNWDLTIIAGIAQLAGVALEQAWWQQEASEARASEAVMREADAMKNEFLAITAHEFRSPLTVILARSQGATRALKRANGNDPLPALTEHLNIITAQAKQLSNIVTTFLDAARINQGQLSLKTQPVDLLTIARQVVEEQAVLAEHHQLRMMTDDPPQIYQALGDESRLHQIIANLVENAIKYSPLGGPVTIGLRRCSAGSIEVSITDQGMGIPVDAQEHLFERFYRAPEVASSETRGVGLGLYIVAHLVEMHGSQIHVESSGVPGEGSRFFFRLPALV